MTYWVAGAVVVGSVIGGVASNKASNSQQQSVRDSNSELARQYDTTRADQLAQYEQQRKDQQPWLDAGQNALSRIMSGIGDNGDLTRRFSMQDFQADPGYQFRMDQGTQGIERAMSARGSLNSGATLKALARFNQDLASQEYGNAYNRYTNDQGTSFNRLASIAGLGQNATNQVGQAGQNAYGTIANAGMNASNQMGQNMIGAGNARASGYVGSANAINNGIGQYMNYSQNQSLLNSLRGGSSSSSLPQTPFGPGTIGAL